MLIHVLIHVLIRVNTCATWLSLRRHVFAQLKYVFDDMTFAITKMT